MGMAICFKCGSAKSGALAACQTCHAVPRTRDDLALSLALSDHLSSKEQLAQYSHEIRSGKGASVPFSDIIQAGDALKDPQLLAMLGAQPSAPSSTTTTPRCSDLDPAIAHKSCSSAAACFEKSSARARWARDLQLRSELRRECV